MGYFKGIMNHNLFNEFLEKRSPVGSNKKLTIKAKSRNDATYVGKESDTLIFCSDAA